MKDRWVLIPMEHTALWSLITVPHPGCSYSTPSPPPPPPPNPTYFSLYHRIEYLQDKQCPTFSKKGITNKKRE